jgi:TldD protein
MRRRTFLQRTAAGLGMVVVPSFLWKNGKAFAVPAGVAGATVAENLNGTYFADAFGIDEGIIRNAMQVAMGRGGEFADLYFQHQVGNYLLLEDGIVNRAYSSVDLGVGVRVVVGNQTGFAFTEELTRESIQKAAETAASIAGGQAGRAPDAYKIAGHDNY